MLLLNCTKKMTIVEDKVMISLENVQSFSLDNYSREKIKKYMKTANTSQRKMAEASKGMISKSFLGQLLSGQTDVITKPKLMCICELLGVTPEMIFSDSVKYFS